jgi:hypothetical protein
VPDDFFQDMARFGVWNNNLIAKYVQIDGWIGWAAANLHQLVIGY